jgi:amidohydrolase
VDVVTLKEQVRDSIASSAEVLTELSRTIQAHPEIAYQEYKAAACISDLLESRGYEVQRGIDGLDTAFVGTCEGGGSGPTIAVIAEYDALPAVGHGCGHNLIAAGTVGAAFGLLAVLPHLRGTLKIFGTPAEESTLEPGGKIRLLETGAFAGVDACVMFHPWTATQLVGSDLAVAVLDIAFQGKAAHAAADPWRGANALDGVLLTYMNINALRQHVKSDVRIHGIVTRGGDAANVVPDSASARFAVRSVDKEYLEHVVGRLRDCVDGAALATATKATVDRKVTIENTLSNRVLEGIVKENLRAEGIEFEEDVFIPGSTDFGNLSQRVPAYWFMLKTHQAGVTWHSQEAATEAVSEAAHAAMLAGATVLATTCVDLLARPDLVERARAEFDDKRSLALGGFPA